MFSTFRALVLELQRLNGHLGALRELHSARAPSEDRLTALEQGRSLFEADMLGLLAKADGKLKAANNAESRERTMRKHHEELAGPFDPEGDEERPTVPDGYAPGVEEEGVQPVYMDVAPTNKERALMAKFS